MPTTFEAVSATARADRRARARLRHELLEQMRSKDRVIPTVTVDVQHNADGSPARLSIARALSAALCEEAIAVLRRALAAACRHSRVAHRSVCVAHARAIVHDGER